ncbi:hypothetical protein JXJ21_03155 [candidate division KSB1 bacterium]|nr:hypothetical protein [candidate division KSB1 bacterium]
MKIQRTLRGICSKSVLLMLILLLSGCKPEAQQYEGKTPGQKMKDINIVMKAHTKELMAIPGVVGLYVGKLENGAACIKIMVVEKTKELEKRLPKTLEGYPVVIDVTGEIKAL